MQNYYDTTFETTLYFEVEHAGYGAILSRLMTGLNMAITNNYNFDYKIKSTYVIDELFNIKKKTSQKKKIWNFMKDTWKNPNKNLHQFPLCPFDKSMSKHQWCSILAYQICGSPKQELIDIINNTKEKLKWNDYDIHIGLHVRRGDKTVEVPYIPTDVYLKYLNEVIEKVKDKKIAIFLCSDDPSTYDEFKNKVSCDILWDFDEKRYNNYNAGMVSNNKDIAKQESISASKIILLLGDCDYVIGMRTAQFTWIGGLLCIYKNNFELDRHYMIDAKTHLLGNWGDDYI
jgi:hypothetical protein